MSTDFSSMTVHTKFSSPTNTSDETGCFWTFESEELARWRIKSRVPRHLVNKSEQFDSPYRCSRRKVSILNLRFSSIAPWSQRVYCVEANQPHATTVWHSLSHFQAKDQTGCISSTSPSPNKKRRKNFAMPTLSCAAAWIAYKFQPHSWKVMYFVVALPQYAQQHFWYDTTSPEIPFRLLNRYGAWLASLKNVKSTHNTRPITCSSQDSLKAISATSGDLQTRI